MTHEIDNLLGYVPMTNAEYHASPGVSKSQLDVVASSPMSYWAKYLDPNRKPEERDEDLVLGSVFHSATLEPHRVDLDYVVMPDFNLRSSKGRAMRDEWLADEVKGRQWATRETIETARAMARATSSHPIVSRLLPGCLVEQSYFAIDPITKARVKCRPDAINWERRFILDLKSTKSASPTEFAKSIFNYRYHVQQAWYQMVLDIAVGIDVAPLYFIFIAVEKKYPHQIGIYTINAEDVQRGERIARRDLQLLLKCQQNNVWPDYTTNKIEELSIPGFGRRTEEVLLGDV